MNADYYLGQATLATESRGFLDALQFDVGLKEADRLSIFIAFLEAKEETAKELFRSLNTSPTQISPTVVV